MPFYRGCTVTPVSVNLKHKLGILKYFLHEDRTCKTSQDDKVFKIPFQWNINVLPQKHYYFLC